MLGRLLSSVAGLSLIVTATPAVAGPDEDVRDSARKLAAEWRSLGMPQNKCHLGIGIQDGVVLNSVGAFSSGDKLLRLGDHDVHSKDTQWITGLIGRYAPNDNIPFVVRRGSEELSLVATCGNFFDIQRDLLRAMDFAASKKWDDCVKAVPNLVEYNNFKISCARVSRNRNSYPIERWVEETYDQIILAGRVNAEIRKGLAQQIFKARLDVSTSKFNHYVSEIKSWDSGETWGAAQPDYAAFKRTAERAVKSRLIDPTSAIIEMPFDFIYATSMPAVRNGSFEGFVTCGTVNAKNRMGGYTGSVPFIAAVTLEGAELFTVIEDRDRFVFLDGPCAGLTQKLSYIGNEGPKESSEASDSAGRPSVSQELQKLAELRASGALSEAEYTAAKARVLSGN